MLPPPGLEPSLASLQDATPTSFLSAAIATATSLHSLGVDLPTITSAVLSTATSISSSSSPKDADSGECRLLGPFAIFVQGALGCAALLALVYKRWRERPQRPMKIWFFDVSKQVVGSVLVHIANLLMSMLSSGQFSIKLDPNTVVARSVLRRMTDEHGNYKPNPCSFYLLNLAIDTTIGIPILILLLRILTALFALTPVGNPRESIESGNYGNPPRAWWWFKQSIIYFLGLMGMKICVLIIFLVLPWISRVGDWALKWTEGDEALQVIFVMLVFPVIMNATQYYIIDSFIKNQKPADHERIPDEDADSTEGHGPYEDPRSGSSDEINSGDEEDDEVFAKEEELQKSKGKAKHSVRSGKSSRTPLKTGNKDYDPLFDGESSPTVVGSASTSERERLVAKEEDSEDEEERPRS
ncbi:vacuolar membrane domain containing protein [Hyaloscypha variabilis]